jgi:protein-disulfide isomerase
MKRCVWGKVLALSCGLLTIAGPTGLFGETVHAGTVGGNEIATLVSPANVAQYVHDRFQIPATVSVNAQPVKHSTVPHFYQTLVTVNDGKQTRAINAFFTDDARCFGLGAVFALNGISEADIIRCVGQAASLPPAAKVTVGAFTKTRLQGFLRSKVTVELGTKAETWEIFVTQDQQAGILGLLLPFRRDFVEQLIDTRDQPSIGPARAPVTIVEYADLECPRCAVVQKFLETEFLPKYSSRVRMVFKEFPLSFHPWANTAALANECAYQIDPSLFLGFRSMIFGAQATISPGNVRDRLLGLGETAGLNRVRLTSCLDSEASLGRIEASRAEVEALRINGTPAFAINGRVVVDMASPAAFYKMVDDALAAAKK